MDDANTSAQPEDSPQLLPDEAQVNQEPTPLVSASNPPLGRRREVIGAASVLGIGALLAVLYKSMPYVQQSTMPYDARIGHLLRRAGFGATPAELKTYSALGIAKTTQILLNYSTVPNPTVDRVEKLYTFDFTNGHELQRWWLLRMLYSTHPLEEKMTLFWHSLLTSALSKVQPEMLYVQNVFLREHALADFPTMLKGISKDPAMMIWLDLQTNRKGHANENFARELMELFTMGVGNYSEQDVRESARAFTGYGLRYNGKYEQGVFNPPVFQFLPGQHDDGAKTFLGHTGNFTGDDIIDIIVKQPATAEYLCKRLFSWFAYEDPEPTVLNALTRTYFSSNYSVRALVEQILTSSAFYSGKAYRALVKSPTEYVIGSARAFDMVTDGITLPNAMPAMGQALFNPPNVAGWPGGTTWLNSGAWLARLNFANALVAAGPAFFRNAASMETWLQAQTGGSSTAALHFLLNAMLDGNVGDAQKQAMLAFGNDATLPMADRLRGLAYLSLALPEYHLS